MNEELKTDHKATSFWAPMRIRIAIVAVLAIFLWGLGWWMGRSGPVEQSRLLQDKLALVEKQASDGERDRLRMGGRNSMLRAHVALLQAINELDQRNFGLAEVNFQQSRASLEKVDAAKAGVDASALASLKEQLSAYSLVVATDLNVQRQDLLAFEARFRALTEGD